ncbi:Rnase Y domain-containing protein, partial [Jatrophihabitans sp.]|uniref:Rnase Y domain-containing protein n=1 Tax=Jatrophihabitans sp. TaxID=1932789 RepID=UPI0030C67350|nr:metal dependent phosphohydrolase [Jatrophihabitans sp.]
MVGVLYAAIGVVLVLGLYFVRAYASRPAAVPGRRSADGAAEHPDESSRVPGAELAGQAAQAAAAQAAAAQAAAAQVAEAQAAAQRAAQADAEALRRALEAEADATRRAIRAEAQSAALDADAVRAKAAAAAAELLADARRIAETEAVTLTADLRSQLNDLAERARRLDDAEDRLAATERRVAGEEADLDRSLAALTARQQDLDSTAEALTARSDELAARLAVIEGREAAFSRELERIAGLTAEQAKTELMAGVEATARRDAAMLVRTIENEARAEGTDRARAIVVEAVQRVASEQTSETVVSVLHLPNDELKGRIIGREGRNIRAYESVTGVNLIIDDTPEAVLLSCFDPVRREVGRLTLERLVQDGRIHPHRIEEAYEQSKLEVDALCLRAARESLAEVGITDLDERLLPTLGRLKYRTSYGQNVLGHLIETAHVAGVMAAELGIEPTLVKRCAFLHDIGKALTHEVQGSHAIIGAELLRKYGEHEEVAHAVEAHHN